MKNLDPKTMCIIISAMLLCVWTTVALNIQAGHAMNTIYIRANGTVEPSTPFISSINNITYFLTGNIEESIVIERDNITLDGQGHTVRGIGSGNGISLTGRISVTVENIRIENFTYGIYVSSSINITIFNNTITGNVWDGIFALDTYQSIFHGNTVSSNKRYGITLSQSSNNRIFHNNFVDNNANQTHIYESYDNVWDNEYPSGGNYWSDYEEKYSNATEIDDSGIWDTQYVIDPSNTDRYPLTVPEFSPATIMLMLTATFILSIILAKKKTVLQQ